MNFKELAERLRTIESAPTQLNIDGTIDECGDMPMPAMEIMHHEQPPQPDNVTMNVSMNGSGKGGIRDLMDILRNLESTGDGEEPEFSEPHQAHDDAIDILTGEEVGQEPQGPGEEMPLAEKSKEQLVGHDVDDDKDHDVQNRPHRTTYNIDTITRHGDDIHSKGDIKRRKVNGGENPLEEGIISRLTEHYNQVKTRDLQENVTTDHTHSTFDHILATYKRDVADFKHNHDMSDELFDALFDYYFDDMPYGVKKGRTGDPYEWVSERFYHDLGPEEHHAPIVHGANPGL